MSFFSHPENKNKYIKNNKLYFWHGD